MTDIDLKELIKNYIKNLNYSNRYNIIKIDGSYNKATDNLVLNFSEDIKKI